MDCTTATEMIWQPCLDDAIKSVAAADVVSG